MSALLRKNFSETQKKRSLLQRMAIVHGFYLVVLLIILARLMELQVVRGNEFKEAAALRHERHVRVKAKRGEILGMSSKTGEKNIFATNTTLDMVYVDPAIANPIDRSSDATLVAETLSDILITPSIHEQCSNGEESCPRELVPYYQAAFDPITQKKILDAAQLLEPTNPNDLPPSLLKLPDLTEARRLFARFIEQRISEKRVTYVPLMYGATKVQMAEVSALGIPGITVIVDKNLIYANPEEVPQNSIATYARSLAKALKLDASEVQNYLRTRTLRYVPVMHKLPPAISLKIKEAQLQSLRETIAKAPKNKNGTSPKYLEYPLRSIALLPEQWRYYPDTTIASHIIGFVNTRQEPQYGVERTYHPLLRGTDGSISTVSDLQGGQIFTTDQRIVDPEDGDSIVLTIDRTVQKKLEELMSIAIEKYDAQSGQALVMDPFTGRMIAVVNVPLFDSNNYADVFAKEALTLTEDQEKKLVVEIYHPDTNARVVRAFRDDVFTASGRNILTEKTRETLGELERLYDLKTLSRYYWYIGEKSTVRRELFPTDEQHVWLGYKNEIGVGAYLNRAVQEIWEPGSVMKPITMAIAIDQGEVEPGDVYQDDGPVKVDEYTIKNALLKYYGKVSMTDCMAFSINTCMTSISFKLGPKLLHHSLELFGFGRITGVEMENELTGEMRPWREWSRSLLATTSFGQGISSTPMQMIAAWGALANGGTLLRPTIVDSILHSDGSVEKTTPKVVEQVLSKRASETISGILVQSVKYGFAKAGAVPGYRLAGKTGTSQIASPSGRGYESGSGSTVGTFMGYGPIDRPKFVILVKIDRPKNTIFGVDAAAPVFRDIAKFLLEYYGIPPDEK